jgi:hypothetical protein
MAPLISMPVPVSTGTTATVETAGEIEQRLGRAKELATVIKRNLRTFVEVGLALRELRDEQLYKELGYPTFQECILAEFGLTRRQSAYEHMQAAEVDKALSGITDKPANLAVSMELFPLLAKPRQLRKAWNEAIKQTKGKAVTAIVLAEIVERLTKPGTTRPKKGETDEGHRADGERDEPEDVEPEEPEEPEEEPWSDVDEAGNAIKMAVDDVLRLTLEQRQALSETLGARIERGELDHVGLQILEGVIQPVLF